MTAGLHILLAEDDPISRSFLAEVLSTAGSVLSLSDGEAAVDAAWRERFDLLVLDLALPRLGGSDIVAVLRGNPSAASSRARMMALSAGLDSALAQHLHKCGFDLALSKPIDATTLLACIRGQAHMVAETPLERTQPILDDALALRTLGGSSETVKQLRALFARELPAQLGAIANDFDTRNGEAVIHLLHRLRASCGFCGALELEQAGQRLLQAVSSGRFEACEITAYLHVAQRLLEVLHALSETDAGS